MKAFTEAQPSLKDAQRTGSCLREDPSHQQELKLYCKTHRQMLSETCRAHRNHEVVPVQEAAEELKQELLQTLLCPLQNKKRECSISKKTYERRLASIKQRTNEAEQHVKKEFDKLYQFLQKEEKIALQKLKQEKKKKTLLMKGKIEKITKEIAVLSASIQEVQQLLGEEDHVWFLRRYPEMVKSCRVKRSTPAPVKTGPVVNVEKAIGSLQYRVWKKMLTVISTAPVTLDPCTAHPYLLLSEEFTSVRHTTKRQQSPSDSPQRFDPCLCVLGREGFTSGEHHWEVMVGQKTEWDVGVVRESISRKEAIDLNPDSGGWIVALRNGYQYRAATKTWKHLDLREKPRKIRVCLDYEGGKVSFYNSENKTHIYTFTATFTEKLYPFFSPGRNDGGKNAEPLKICPRRVIIREE
ncbi:zinc-binding protein A33-like [Chiloscyllium plagiosum]|uniref:zinc-binding protein A33-like n=1 Tax=Chiloscyllium plagiosum TaxID=36176 RepID=UPI001CB80AAF|nr:zinc-binding protein A33-like [Chiloscyllium plagiosum]